MYIGLLFWIIMALWLVLGLVRHGNSTTASWPAIGFDLLMFILFAVLGWSEFGPALHR